MVVYSIIFYGIKTRMKVRNVEGRTDKETPYVPVPEGGVNLLTPLIKHVTVGPDRCAPPGFFYLEPSMFGNLGEAKNTSVRRRKC